MSLKPIHSSRRRVHRQGTALILVLVAVAMASIISIAFAASQSISSGIAKNAYNQSRARMIAESGMELALSELARNANWRTTYTNGVWVNNFSYGGGTLTVRGEDGVDTNGDGVIDGDANLADDSTDKLTLTVIGTYGGVTHRVRTVVTPKPAVSAITVLMVVNNVSSLTASEQSRKSLIEGWGWTVGLIAAGATSSEYTNALALAHVVYVPEEGGSNIAGAQLVSTDLGVVWEDGDMNDELGASTAQASYSGTAIDIVDNTHYITSPFGTGSLTIASAASTMEMPNGSVATGMTQLAKKPGAAWSTVAYIDAGEALVGGGSAVGRRALSPFSGFTAAQMTDDGKNLLKRMLEWSAQSALTNDTVVALGNWVVGTTVAKPTGEDRLLVVSVAAETTSSLTAITYGNQPMTLAVSAYESTGVGARNYLYYLREVNLAAATDTRIRATWSSTPDELQFASRFYKNVNQACPLRVTNGATNAGPSAISTATLTVSRGDMVFASAMVGNPVSYTWTTPMVEGTDHPGSTSGHTAAQYPITADGTVKPTATTTGGANRQAMVGAVLQPRSQSAGEGVIPQLLVLYEFEESDPTPVLLGNWTLDGTGAGGALAIFDDVALSGSTVIDGYHGSAGAYGAGNKDQSVILVTDTDNNGSIALSTSAKIFGSTYNDPGANPTNVVSLSGSASITGNRYEQSVAFTLPAVSAPSGMPSSLGNVTLSSGSVTINSDRKYDDLTITGGTYTISGDIRIQVTDDFTMSGGTIVVPSGSKLRIYVGDQIAISNGAILNSDTTGAGRLEINQYSSSGDLSIRNTAKISGIVRVGRDLLMYDTASIYGAVYVGDDLTMSTSAAVHIDLDMAGYHIIPVGDAVGTNPALAHGGPTFGQTGARAATNTSIRFDGTTDFIIVPHHDDYLLHNATLSFWFYSESLTGQHALVSKDSAGYDTGGHLHVYTDGTTLKARIQTNGSSPFGTGDSFEASATGLAVNTWYHVAVTLGAGGLRLYRDGALVNSVSYPGALGASSGGIGNYQPMVLGAGTSTAGDLTHLPLDTYFQGRMDDVRLYSEVLDAAQINRIYQSQAIGARTEASYVVRDTSGLGTPLDLFLDSTTGVSWGAAGLTLSQGTVIRAPESPSKIRNGATATGQFSLEFIASPSNADSSTRRLFWYGANSGSNANLDLRQESLRYIGRGRSAGTGSSPPDVQGQFGLLAGHSYHLVFTYDGEYARLYRDGALEAETAQTGGLLSWDASYGMTLANVPLASAPWLGTIKRVAVFDRALNQRQIDNLVNGSPPGDGATSGNGFTAKWYEGY